MSNLFQQTIDHRIAVSFLEYIDNRILTKGQTFSIVSTGFYLQTGARNTQVTVYASPYKGFIYDNGLTGAQVITGVSGDGTFIGRGTSGLTFDYPNGRILFTTNPNFGQVSGTFALKEVNIKYTTKSTEELLKQTKYIRQPIAPQTITGIKENVETYPIIFVNYTPGNNKGAALGGLDDTRPIFNCLCVMDNQWNLDGVLGVLRDLNASTFGLFDTTGIPLNVSGDLKDINYNYTGMMASKEWPNTVFIESVNTIKMPPELNAEFGPDVFIGEAEAQISYFRYPRQ